MDAETFFRLIEAGEDKWVNVFSVMAFTQSAALNPPAEYVSKSRLETGVSNHPEQHHQESTLDTLSSRGLCRARSGIIVAKFGGSSLADSERITKAAKSVAEEVRRGAKVVVVVSAMGKTTDVLMEILQNSSRGVEKHDIDDILSMGERTSVRVFAAALKSEGLRVKYFDPHDDDWPIITDDNFSNANPILEECKERIREHVFPLLSSGVTPIIAGFVGRTRTGKISTIGRGGSDTTAFILAQALGAEEVILVTDSEGIMTADPKLVHEARRLDHIDVNVLVQLADSGKKFIHRKALRYKDPKIDVRVISLMKGDLEAEGTRITGSISSELEVELATRERTFMLTIVGRGLARNPKIISQLAEEVEKHTELLGMSANSDSIILYVKEKSDLEHLYRNIHGIMLNHEETISMNVRAGLAYLKVKGVGLEETPGLIGKISEALRINGINIFGILTITSSILIFVDYGERERANSLIKAALGLG
ncbi:MAG: aspartate kinase [Candidatus Bathyarchaeia archaeon]